MQRHEAFEATDRFVVGILKSNEHLIDDSDLISGVSLALRVSKGELYREGEVEEGRVYVEEWMKKTGWVREGEVYSFSEGLGDYRLQREKVFSSSRN